MILKPTGDYHKQVLLLRAKNRWLFVGIILCIVGVGAVLWARHLGYPEEIIVSTLGQAMVTTAIVAWVYEYFSKKDVLELLDARLSVSDSFRASGIFEIAEFKYDWAFAYFDSARRVRLLSLDAERPFSLKRDVIKNFLLRGGTFFECLFVNPSAGMVKLIEQQRSTVPNSQRERYDTTVERLGAIVNQVKDELKKNPRRLRRRSRVVVRQYSDLSYCSLMLFDKKTCIYKPYFAHSRGEGVPAYYASHVPGGLYDVCQAHYRFIRERSEVVMDEAL